MNDKKDFITISIAIFRHSFGISFWGKSEPTKLEEKVSRWKNENKETGKKKADGIVDAQVEALKNIGDALADLPAEKPAKK